jgi:hypothetical protein
MVRIIDDILAALILSLFMFRRLEVLTIQASDNLHVPPEQFAAWKNAALSGYRIGAIACAAKVVLNQTWFHLMKHGSPLVLSLGGISIFLGWILALVWSWRQTTEANAIRVELQIRRPEPPPKPH